MTDTVENLLDAVAAARSEIVFISESIQKSCLEHNKSLYLIRDQLEDLNAILAFQIDDMGIPKLLKSQLLTQCYELLDQKRSIQRIQQFISTEEDVTAQLGQQIGDEELKYLLVVEAIDKFDAEYNSQIQRKRDELCEAQKSTGLENTENYL